ATDAAEPVAVATTPSAAVAAATTWRERLRGVLQAEDWIIFAWFFLVDAVLERLVGGDLRSFATSGQGPRWLIVVVGVCFAIVFSTRGPEDVDPSAAASRRCVLSVVLFFATRRWLAGDGSWLLLVGAWVVLVVVAMGPVQANLERLPRTGHALRRTLV